MLKFKVTRWFPLLCSCYSPLIFSVIIFHVYVFILVTDFCIHYRTGYPYHSLYIFFSIWKCLPLFPPNAGQTLNYELPGNHPYSRFLKVWYYGHIKSEMIMKTALLRPALFFLNYLALNCKRRCRPCCQVQ